MLRRAVLILLLTGPLLSTAHAGAEQDAVTAARAWLALTDEARWADSWEQAAQLFRGAITAADWEQSIGGVRPALGAMTSRELGQARRHDSLPGAPDGDYFVLEFDSVFEKKAAAVETVTVIREPDNAWRVAGYFIR